MKRRPTNPKFLYWGMACRNDETHTNDENKAFRLKGLGCVLCLEKYAGMTVEQIEQQITDAFNSWVPPTPESVRQRQIEHSRNWTKRNMDKHNEYQRRYFEKLSEEKKEERKQKQREDYAKNREKIMARNKAWYERKKAEKNAKNREILKVESEE